MITECYIPKSYPGRRGCILRRFFVCQVDSVFCLSSTAATEYQYATEFSSVIIISFKVRSDIYLYSSCEHSKTQFLANEACDWVYPDVIMLYQRIFNRC